MYHFRQWSALLVLVAARVTYAQNSTAITPLVVVAAMPQCAQSCIITEIKAASCSMTNLTLFADCICKNVPLQSAFNTCVQGTCVSTTDWGTALGIEGLLCATYPKEDRTSVSIIAAIVGIAIVVPCIAARLTSRLKYTGRLWPDDYMSIFTFILFLGLAAILIVSARLGLGIHFWNMKAENAIPIMKIFVVSQVMYIFVSFAGKLAILLLYQRVFDGGTARWFSITLKFLVVLQCVDSLLYLCLILLECIPLAAMWDKSITNAKCLDLHVIALAGSFSSIATDVILILLPMPMLWRLQVSRPKKVGLTLIFGVAFVGTIASAVRLSYLVKNRDNTDQTWNSVDLTVWSLIELLCMIVCGCVPAMRPLLARVVPSVNLSISWQRASKGTDQYPKASKVSSGAFSSNQSASHAYDQKSDIWLTTLPASGAQPTRKAAENEVPLPRRPESQDRLYSQYDV